MALDVFKKFLYLSVSIIMVLETSVAFAVDQPVKSSFISSHFLSSSPAWFKRGYAVLQLGGHWNTASSQQQINIQDLIGDKFFVAQKNSSDGLVGDTLSMVKNRNT